MNYYNFCSFILEISNTRYLLYSCIVTSKVLNVKTLQANTIKFDDNKSIVILTARINQLSFDEINKLISDNYIDGPHFLNKKYSIVDRHSFYQIGIDSSKNNSRFTIHAPESFGGGTSKVEVYYTESQSKLLELYNSLNYTDKLFFNNNILSLLEKHSGLSFNSAYRYRIGCLEIHIPLSTTYPYMKKDNEGFVITRPKENFNNYCLHVVLRNGEEIIYDKLLFLDCTSIKEFVIGSYNNAEITIFNKGGELIHKEHHSYIETISLNMTALSNNKIYINDDITKKLHGQKEEEKAKIIDRHATTHPSVVSFDKTVYKKNKNLIHDTLLKKSTNLKGSFFGKYHEINDKGKAFAWLIDLINQSNIVTIIDPYFSSKVVTESLRRVRQDVSVHVITSLETNGIFNEQDTINGFKQTLNDYANEIVCKLKIENLTKIGGNKLFHDRFIIIHEGSNKVVYMLSNSLSGYCEDFPFTVMPLDSDTAEKVLSYFEMIEKDRTREVLWDSTALPEQSNILELKKDKEDELLNSDYFKSGLSILFGEKNKRFIINNDTIEKDTFGLLTFKELSFSVNVEVLKNLLQQNLFNKSYIFKNDELAFILITLGELFARCHYDVLFEEVILWLDNLKEKNDLQEVFNIICQIYDTIIINPKQSPDVSHPVISSKIGIFQYAESAFDYGFGYSHKYWGLFFSSKFLIKSIKLDIMHKNISPIHLTNILSGIIDDLIPRFENFDQYTCEKLLSSNSIVVQIFGMVYLNVSNIEIEKTIEILNQNKIEREIIILSLVRRYKELMHNYFRSIGRNKDLSEIEKSLDLLSECACKIWDEIEISEENLNEIYSSFFGRYQFIYRFGTFLNNTKEKNKLYQLIINEIEKKYGWASNDEIDRWISDNEIEEINWAASAYLEIFGDELIKGLYKWTTKFINPAKSVLSNPIYKGNSKNIADRFALLLYFVSEFLMQYINNGNNVSNVITIIDSLYKHTKDLFESEKCNIFSVNENIYNDLLTNLTHLIFERGELLDHDKIGNIYPFSNYLLCAVNDELKIIEYGPSMLDELISKTEESFFITLRWIYFICVNMFANKKILPQELKDKYNKTIENMNIIDDDIYNFPQNVSLLLNNEIKEINVNYNGKIFSVFKRN